MNAISKDEALSQRKPPIEMSPAAFREAGHQLIEDIADFMSGISNYPVTTAPSPKSLQEKLPKEFPLNGTDSTTLLKETWELLVNNSLFNSHPRFWGYITSSPAPVGMLGDLIAAAINSNCGAFVLSPMATEIEKQTIQWLAQLIGYPAGGGIMVSGGNVANLIGFLAARKAKADWDIRKLGLEPSQGKWRIYTSAETHTWIHKAADLFGFGLDAIRWIPVDQDQRMNVQLLDQKIIEDKNAGLVPFLVVGTAGSVGTGTVDSLHGIASACNKHDCWFHVDGAYGGFAAALSELKDLFLGLELADSVAIDPHKWLYSPLEAGCTLVKDPNALTDAFSFHPVYYNFDNEDEPQTNFYERGFQNSRGFRALKVWLGLRQVGFEGHMRMIREDIRLAQRLNELLKQEEDIEPFTQHLSITTFRYRPKELGNGKEKENKKEKEDEKGYLNELNQELLDRLQFGGAVFPSNAVIDGNFLLRVCIVNFRTRLSDIEVFPEIVVKEGRMIHEQMQKKKVVPSS